MLVKALLFLSCQRKQTMAAPCQLPHNIAEIFPREFANEPRNLVLPQSRGINMAQMRNRKTNCSRERASKKVVAKCSIIFSTKKAFCIRKDSPIYKFVLCPEFTLMAIQRIKLCLGISLGNQTRLCQSEDDEFLKHSKQTQQIF